MYSVITLTSGVHHPGGRSHPDYNPEQGVMADGYMYPENDFK